jgi:TRAP-type C4-dicarboxylate transport system permease small subunit
MSEQQLSRVQTIAGKIANLPTKGFHWLSGGALLAIVFMVTIDVILRASLNAPIRGSYELAQLMMVFVACFSFAYSQVFRRHIAIPILVMRFPEKVQLILECSAWLMGCILYGMVAWQSTIQAFSLIELGYTTLALEIPIGPVHFVVVIGCALFSAVLMANFIETLQKVKQ